MRGGGGGQMIPVGQNQGRLERGKGGAGGHIRHADKQNAHSYPPTAVGYSPTAVGNCQTPSVNPPNAVGYPPKRRPPPAPPPNAVG